MTDTSSIHDPADLSAAAADSRAAALERDTLGHSWRKQTLQPWNKRREILFLALEKRAQESDDFVEIAANSLDLLPVVEKRALKSLDELRASLPKTVETVVKQGGEKVRGPVAPVEVELPDPDTLINWHGFLASASRVLWLAHHTFDGWAHLRADPDAWLQQIEDWADDFIDAPEIIAAVRLAYLLRNEHQQFITLPRPEKRNGKIESGN